MKQRILAAIFMLTIIGGLNAWGQGSRPRAVSTTAIAESSNRGTVSSSAFVAEGLRASGRIRVHGFRDGYVKGVEFYDVSGKRTRVITRGTKHVGMIHASEVHNLIVVQEIDQPKRFIGDIGTIVRVIGEDGKELWSIRLCCGSNMGYDCVSISSGGELVAVTDAGEGEACLEGYGGAPAPKGCYGLRVFTANGKEILRVPYGDQPQLSSHGRYIGYLSRDDHGWRLFETATGKIELLRGDEIYGRVGGPDDNGVVPYWNHKTQKSYLYRFGLGITEGASSPGKEHRP